MPELQTQGTYILIGMVLAYLAVTTWLTFRYRAKSTSDFMFAARSVPALVIGVLMMSEFIAPKSTIGVAQVAFDSGMAASWAVLSVALGFPLFGWLLAKKLYNTGEYTISAAIAKEYGRSTQLTVSVIMIYALLLVNVAFYVSGAAALSSAFHMSLTTSAVIIAAVSSFYCTIGGQKSAAYVSLLHTTLKCVGIAIILCVALSMTGGVAPMMEKMPDFYFTWDGKIGITTIIAWTIASIGSIFSTQYIIQAVSSLKGPQDITRACWTAALLCLPVSFALGLIGVAAKFLFPNINSLYALPIFMNHMSPVLAGIVLTSFVASILVGVSSVALAISALVVRDFYVPMRQPSQEAQLRMSRLLSVPIGFLPLLFVFFAPQVLHLSFFTRALRLSISVVAIFAFYLPRFGTNRGATAGLIAATVTTTAWYVAGDPFGIDDIYVALATPAIVMLLDWLFMGAPKADTDHAMEMKAR
jgi:SSS family solute:Na+ symporter